MAKERETGPFEQIGEAVGSTVGKVVGRANDMAANVASSLLGSAIETMGDWWSQGAEQAARTFGDREDRACREHFTSRTQSQPQSTTKARPKAPKDYEGARPLYEFGYVAGQNPEYQARPFDRVEADLERAWESVGRDRFGEWPEVRDHVRFGYTYRAEGAPNPS
jgi:hypothetical protein